MLFTYESKKEIEERRSMYLSVVLGHNQGGADEAKLIAQANKKFDKENGLPRTLKRHEIIFALSRYVKPPAYIPMLGWQTGVLEGLLEFYEDTNIVGRWAVDHGEVGGDKTVYVHMVAKRNLLPDQIVTDKDFKREGDDYWGRSIPLEATHYEIKKTPSI